MQAQGGKRTRDTCTHKHKSCLAQVREAVAVAILISGGFRSPRNVVNSERE